MDELDQSHSHNLMGVIFWLGAIGWVVWSLFYEKSENENE